MRFTRRHPLLTAVLLCALAVLAARPADGDGDHAPGHGSASGVGAEVARLYEEAAAATERYEQRRSGWRSGSTANGGSWPACTRTWGGSPAPSTGTAAACRSRRTCSSRTTRRS